MMKLHKHRLTLIAAPLLAGGLTLAPAMAQQAGSVAAGTDMDRGEVAGQVREARDTVQEATRVVQQMAADPELRRQMDQARGILIAPNFARAAAGLGAQGGEGVVLLRKADGSWSAPAFYNFGGVSVGAQAGASAGAIAFLLMNDRAVEQFKSTNTFSLDANAGLSIVDYSARAQASVGKGDVIAWSDTEGLFAGAAIGVSNVHWDDEETRAYYGDAGATPQSVLTGDMDRTPSSARSLQTVLAQAAGPDRSAAKANDTSTAGGARETIAAADTTRDADALRTPRADRN